MHLLRDWRIGRTSYWASVVALLVAHGAARLLAPGLEAEDAFAVGLTPGRVIDLLLLAPWLGLIWARLRDLSVPGVWALVYLPFALAAAFLPQLGLLATAFAYVFILGAGVPAGPQD
jgi:uncharacterized membrane protein YhaH (DUF805 family)